MRRRLQKEGSIAMKKLMASLLVAGALGVAPGEAANPSGQFNVNLTLNSPCSLSAVTAVAFTYTPLQGAVQNGTAGGYTVTCTNNPPHTFGLQAGTGPATTPGAPTNTVTAKAANPQYLLRPSAPGG